MHVYTPLYVYACTYICTYVYRPLVDVQRLISACLLHRAGLKLQLQQQLQHKID